MQKAVSAHLLSEQILLFGLAWQYCSYWSTIDHSYVDPVVHSCFNWLLRPKENLLETGEPRFEGQGVLTVAKAGQKL